MSFSPYIPIADFRVVKTGYVEASLAVKFFDNTTSAYEDYYKWIADAFRKCGSDFVEKMKNNGSLPDENVEIDYSTPIKTLSDGAAASGGAFNTMVTSMIVFYANPDNLNLVELAETLHEFQGVASYMGMVMKGHSQSIADQDNFRRALDAFLFAWRESDDDPELIEEDRNLSKTRNAAALQFSTTTGMPDGQAKSFSTSLLHGLYALESYIEDILTKDIEHLESLFMVCRLNWNRLPELFRIVFGHLLKRIAFQQGHTEEGRCINAIMKVEIFPAASLGDFESQCERKCNYDPPQTDGNETD